MEKGLGKSLEQKRLSAYMGQMNAILFSPEDLALVKEHHLLDGDLWI